MCIGHFIIPLVMEHPTFDELTEEYPDVVQMHESIQQLNAGQKAALERAYQSKFHIIQGAPGTLSTSNSKLTVGKFKVSSLTLQHLCILYRCQQFI